MKKLIDVLPKTKYTNLFVYLIVGGLATIVEWVGFWIFDSLFKNLFEGFEYGHLLATAIAFFFSTFANWGFGRLLMFSKREGMTLIGELASVYATSIIGLLFNLILMYLFVNLLSINEMISKMIATAVVFAYNYIVRQLIIYKNK